jgi:hypothetical protein
MQSRAGVLRHEEAGDRQNDEENGNYESNVHQQAGYIDIIIGANGLQSGPGAD